MGVRARTISTDKRAQFVISEMEMGGEEEQECRHEKAQSLARRFQTSIHKKSSQVEDKSVKKRIQAGQPEWHEQVQPSSSDGSADSGSLSSALALVPGCAPVLDFLTELAFSSITSLDFRFRADEEEFPTACGMLLVATSCPPPAACFFSIAATSSAVRNRPPGPRGRRIAWLWRDSCRYGLRPFDVSRSCSSSFWRATRRFRMRWNCFALT